jgi:Tfp pilus assembly PilM family ATPase
VPPRDEISSTEKLLEQIRGRAANLPPSAPAPNRDHTPRSDPPRFTQLRNRLPLKLKQVVGVDIGYSEVRLVRTRSHAAGGREIVDFRCVPFETGQDRSSALFPRFLRSVLADFCPASEAVEIWSAVSSAHLDIRYLRIPKVARRQVANAVYWAYRKKNPFNESQSIFDFDILGEVEEEGRPKLEVVAFTLPAAEAEELEKLFARSGYPLTGITSYPFLMQNLLRGQWRDSKPGNTCALYIGRHWSRIDLFAGGNLVLSRGIKTGMSSMIAEIKAHPQVMASPPSTPRLVEMGAEAAPEPPESHEPVSDFVAGDILVSLIPAHPSATIKARQLNLSASEVFQIVLPAVERLLRQVERTVGHFAAHFGTRAFDRLCVAGQIAASPLVVSYMAEQLGIPLEECNPFNDVSGPLPEAAFERESYLPAAALALSANRHTPNFLYTFQDEFRRKRQLTTSRGVMGLFVLLVAVLMAVSTYQSRLLERRQQEVANLQKQLNAIVPLVNRDLVLMLAARAKNAARQLQHFGERYQGVALVGELSRLTPPAIRLVDLRAEFPAAAAKGEETPRRRLIIDGVVAGERSLLEPTLAGYMVRLKSSPLLAQPRIVTKAFDVMDGSEVLKFSAELEVI